MLDNKLKITFTALLGAVALSMSAPAFAQDAAAPAAPAAAEAAAPAPADAAPAAPVADAPADPPTMKNAGKLNVGTMFADANMVVKVIMIGLIVASVFSWTILVTKILELRALNRVTDGFVEAFRSAKSAAEVSKVAMLEEYDGNPLADMAAAATQEVALSQQAGLKVFGDHRDTTLGRAHSAVNAVQAALSRRLSGGMQFLASVGSNGPFIGLFGTVYGIMNSFIGIANTNTTNLAVVAPGIAEALLATGLGLFAAIPSVIFYNYFQTRISAYGARTEGFVAELMNSISRQLDKGA